MTGVQTCALPICPSGKVQIDDEIFDAMAEEGYIDKDVEVKVTKNEAGQLYVMRK